MQVVEKGNISSIDVIIKPNKNASWDLAVLCTGTGQVYNNVSKGLKSCGARLEVNENDIIALPFAFGNWRFGIKCPQCCCVTVVDTNKISASAQQNAITKYQIANPTVQL